MGIKFIKKVSRGSRFNQIYVPKELENLIEPEDEVEVRLLRKHIRLHYSTNLKKLSGFKENLIKNIFSILYDFDYITQIFVVGSFLTEKIDYNDIDIVPVVKNRDESIGEIIYNKLVDSINLKFHILVIEKNRLDNLLKICPLTRVMFDAYVSDKSFKIPSEKIINEKHLKFLLMMPKDLLEIKLSSRTFYDNIRRLIAIERFLENESLNILVIKEEFKKLIKNQLFTKLKNNGEIGDSSINFLRNIMKTKIKKIEYKIRHGQK